MTSTFADGPIRSLSLRGRVVAISPLLVVAALLASNALLVTLLQRHLIHQLDERLHTATLAAAHLPDLTGTPDRTPPHVRDALERELTGDVYAAYLDADGQVRKIVRPAENSAPRLPDPDIEAVRSRHDRPFRSAAEKGDAEWRVTATVLDDTRGQQTETVPRGSVVVAASLEPVDTTIRHLGLWMLVIDSCDDLEVVAEASDGRQAVELVRVHRPDVVLMDIRMPGTDGLAATEAICQDEDLRDTRILVLTTFQSDDHVARALHLGASGFLGKNTTADALLDGIRTIAAGDALLSPAATRSLITRLLSAPFAGPEGVPPRTARRPHSPRTRGGEPRRGGQVQRRDRRRTVPQRSHRPDPHPTCQNQGGRA